MSSYTPGPWTFYADLPSTDPNWHIVTIANKMRVLANVHIEPGNAMDEANARLIAAAPELLAALREIEAICTESARECRKRMGTRVGNALTTALVAIAKAEGRS